MEFSFITALLDNSKL